MRKQKAELLGDVLNRVLREEGLETPINEYRLVNEAWPEVMGQAIMRYTGNIYVRNSTLYVQLKSPALRHNLLFGRDMLVHRLNKAVGAQVIEHIVLM